MSHKVWFMIARDVTAAMLVIKNKNVSLLWELNTTFMKIIQKIVHCINHQHCCLAT